MFNLRYFLVVVCVVCLFLGLSTGVFAQGSGSESAVLTPVMPDGFGFDVSGLFTSLMNVLLPGIAAAIGLSAAFWGITLLWHKIRSVAK
jgi:hypothetical protein